jgi:iron complex outermembrane receptor protein
MRIAVLAMAISLSIVGLSFAADADAAMRKTTNIPAGGLGPALNVFAKERDLQVVYQSEVVGDRKTGGAAGDLTLDEALTQLLSGTGLTYKFLDDKAITIIPLRTLSTRGGSIPLSALEEREGARDSGKGEGLQGEGLQGEASSGKGPKDPSGRGAEGKKGFWSRFRLAQAEGASNSSQTEPSHSEKTNASENSQESSQSQKVEEIIVTAQKREERLQDVPVPVTAIRGDTLVNSNQLRLQDYYTRIPGLSVAPGNQSFQFVSIRGLTTGDFTNPTVGITVDDVPFGSSTELGGGLVVPDIDPGDLARVEVLRGPQGTLYGASSIGGLLKFVTVDPSTDAVSGRLQGALSSVRNGDEVGYNLRGSVNAPLSDTFAVRASGFTRRDPGYIDNPVLGIDGINEQRVSGGRLSALWRASEAFSLKFSALFQDVKGDGRHDVLPALGDLQQSYLRGVGPYDRKAQAYNATLTARLGSVELTALSGYNINEFSDSFDYTYALGDFFTAPLFGVTGTPVFNDNKTEKFTQELRLSAPVGPKVDWLFGAFYTHEKSSYAQTILAVDPATGASAGEALFLSFPTTYQEYAVFTDVTFHVTDRFDVQVGGRESHLEQTSSETNIGPFVPFFFPGFTSPALFEKVDTTDNAFTYLVTPRFRVSRDLMVYARLASGYRAGGPNAAPGVPRQFNPDRTQNYEVGVKADFLDHRLSVDTSLYYIDWKDIQLSLINPVNFQAYTANGSRAKSQGLELSVESRPLTGLVIATWVAWSDAELTEDLPAGSAPGRSGDRLPYGSRFSGNFSLERNFPLPGSLSGFVGGSLSYVGDRKGVFGGTRQTLPAYAKTDLRAGVRHDSWSADFFVNNVADRRGVLNGGVGAVPPFAFNYIQPRTVGLSLAKTF